LYKQFVYVPKLPNNIRLITKINTTNKINIPIEEIDRVIVFKHPFKLKNAVKNEPSNSSNNNNKSKDSGKGFNTCGIIKLKIIKIIINTNEIKPRYFFIKSTSLSLKTPFNHSCLLEINKLMRFEDSL